MNVNKEGYVKKNRETKETWANAMLQVFLQLCPTHLNFQNDSKALHVRKRTFGIDALRQHRRKCKDTYYKMFEFKQG